MIKYWDPRSVVQTVRPLVCSSNSATPGLQFKQWDPRSGAQILRTKVCGSNTESPGLHFMSCRPGLSVFKLQTWVLSIQAPDLVCHCLNFRPGVSPTFLPTLCQLFANFLPLFANFSLFLNFSTLLQTFSYLVAGVAWRRYLPRRASLAFQLAFPGTYNLLIPDICIFYCLFKLFVSTVFWSI